MIIETNNVEIFLELLKENNISKNPYLSYEYFNVYVRNYKTRGFKCLIIQKDKTLIGLLPLYKKWGCFYILGYRASNYLGYICKEDDYELMYKEISLYMKNKYPFSIVNYYDINTKNPLYEILDKDGNKKTYLYDCPYVDCNQTFEELFYSKITQQKKRREFVKFYEKLQLNGEVDVINIDDKNKYDSYSFLVEKIYKVHEERFHDVYIPNDLCLHKNQEYYSELFKSLVFSKKALLSIMTVDGVVVSFMYTALSQGIVMDWMPAFDPAFSKYNLGTVHLMKLLEYLCSKDEYDTLDFSKGAAVYKARWSCGTTYNYMFVKRNSKNLITLLKQNFLLFPINLKNKLRKTGKLEKIKNSIVKIKSHSQKEKQVSVNKPVIYDINSIKDGLVKLTYRYISAFPIENRKKIVYDIYSGIEYYIDDNQQLYCLKKQERN